MGKLDRPEKPPAETARADERPDPVLAVAAWLAARAAAEPWWILGLGVGLFLLDKFVTRGILFWVLIAGIVTVVPYLWMRRRRSGR